MIFEPVGRALNTSSAVEHVRVDHRGLEVAVAEEFLHGADVVAGLQKMGRERMPQRVAARLLRDTGPNDGLSNGPLNHGFMEVVTAPLASQTVYIGPGRSKDPLPFPLAAGRRGLGCQSSGQRNVAVTAGEILLVGCLSVREVRALVCADAPARVEWRICPSRVPSPWRRQSEVPSFDEAR